MSLGLRVRDVQLASQRIAERHGNDEFTVLINRISEIENRGLVPSMYKLYSLSAIYRLAFEDVLEWYGISLSSLSADGLLAEIPRTHAAEFRTAGLSQAMVPITLDPAGIDPRKTMFISRMVQKWGRVPLMLFDALNPKEARFGFMGTEDWFMYPLIQPGSFLMIDETRRKIPNSGWLTEFERPIYFLEHREGYACGWCTTREDQLILQPHPASGCQPKVYSLSSDIDIVGQVVGIAMRLEADPSRRPRSRPAE